MKEIPVTLDGEVVGKATISHIEDVGLFVDCQIDGSAIDYPMDHFSIINEEE